MATTVASWTRELEVLVRRGLRRGRLLLDELLEVYAQLRPDLHPLLGDPRQIDLAACATALARLPAGLFDAPRVWLVPELEPYGAAPVASSVAPAGALPDGTLVIEASFGSHSVLNLVAPLCLLLWEARKAQRLLAAAASDVEVNDEPAAAKTISTADDGGSTDEDETLVGSVTAHLAFLWGLEPRALNAAAVAAPQLVPLLVGEVVLPELHTHVELAGSAAQRCGAQRGARVVQLLAEMGLAGRPLVLWLGESVFTDCLSPYCRELRAVLEQWAVAHPDLVGEDLAELSGALDENALYALARDFWLADPALTRERDEAERTIGILRCTEQGEAFELIDLGRIEPGLCDVRLSGWRLRSSPAPVVIRISPTLGEATVALVEQILATVGQSLIGVTVVLPGSVLGGASGALVAPQLLVRWAGEELVQIPAAGVPLTEVQSFAEGIPRQGAVLSVPSAAWLSAVHLGELVRRLGIVAVEIGGGDLIRTLAEARWSGLLPPAAELAWWVVHHQLIHTGRSERATLGAEAAIALASLRRIAGPEPQRPAPARAEKPTRRGVRLKV